MKRLFFLAIAFVLVIGSAKPVTAQTAPGVVLSILNTPDPTTGEIVVVQGDPVAVEYDVTAADTSPDDMIQLRRVDDLTVVSEVLRGTSSSGTVSLPTSSEHALGVLEVVFISAASGALLAKADETVTVIEETTPEPSRKVKVRSMEALRSAIDNASEGTTIVVEAGDYLVNEPILIRNKRNIVIKGRGSGQKGKMEPGKYLARETKGPITRFIGSPPNPVLDEEGDLMLRADSVDGVFNVFGSDVVFKHMRISGNNAGVAVRNSSNGRPSSIEINNGVVENTGRGILFVSDGNLTVRNTTIIGTRWNGISVGPSEASQNLAVLTVSSASIFDSDGAGIYFSNAYALIDGAWVVAAQGGGILGNACTGADIRNSDIMFCKKAGILLKDCGGGLFDVRINNNDIVHTDGFSLSGGENLILGDGLSLWLSQADVINNRIQHSWRAGMSLFGAEATVVGNLVKCQLFDLAGNPFQGVDYAYHNPNPGSNICGCGSTDAECRIDTATMEPPEPVGGLE